MGPSKILGLPFKLNQFELVCKRDFSCYFFFLLILKIKGRILASSFLPKDLFCWFAFTIFLSLRSMPFPMGYICLRDHLSVWRVCSWCLVEERSGYLGLRLLVQEDFVSLIISAQRGMWCFQIITKTRAICIWFRPKFWFDF